MESSQRMTCLPHAQFILLHFAVPTQKGIASWNCCCILLDFELWCDLQCQATWLFRTCFLAWKVLVNLPFALLEAYCSKWSYYWCITCSWTERSKTAHCLSASIPVATTSCRCGVSSPAGLMEHALFISLTMASKLLMNSDLKKKAEFLWANLKTVLFFRHH